MLSARDSGRDFTIFDYDQINDSATWEQPTAAPTGIDYVVVNGEVTIAEGKYTGAKAGRVLRGSCFGKVSGEKVRSEK